MPSRRNIFVLCCLICLPASLLPGCKKALSGKQATPDKQPASEKVGTAPSNPLSTQGGPSIARPDLRVIASTRLRDIYLAYKAASIDGRVSGPASLGKEVKLTDGLNRPFEVVWQIDLEQALAVNPQMLLAWEASPDQGNTRQVVRVNGSVDRLSEADFQKAAKAKP